MKNIVKSLYNKIILHRWDLAFIDSPIDEILNGKEISIKRVKYKFHGRWFADPFILDYNDEDIVLLVEDFSDSNGIGKISKMVVDKNSLEIRCVKEVLSLSTHLSFPAVIRKEEKIYIYPENSQSGGLWLYEFKVDSGKCLPIRQLSERPLTDAIYTSCFGEDIVFSTEEPSPNGKKMGIYKLNRSKKYDLSGEIEFEERIGRNAGDIFEHQGRFYRPAQECNKMYGHSISIQEIYMSNNSFELKEVRRILPPKGTIGVHTFNTYKGLTVIDVKVFRHPWIASPLFKLRHLFK